MQFFRRAPGAPRTLGVLPGSFNPPTRAHLALARAALGVVDEVAFVLPRVFPHKTYEGASFEDRVRMLLHATAGEERFSVASTEGGLFIEIAHECASAYGRGVDVHFICGADAADRIVTWDYGAPGAFREQLEEYGLLVAARGRPYEPPAEYRDRICPLRMEEDYSDVSATEVRERIRRGEQWEHLVPEDIVPLVRELYLQ